MNVCLLSSSDGRGGAFAATYRLHKGLLKSGVNSMMFVAEKTSDDETILCKSSKIHKLWNKIIPTIDSLPLKFYIHRYNTTLSVQWFPNSTAHDVLRTNPDIINVHWVCFGFLNVQSMRKLRRPIVLTLHDMWPFTGICHYSQDCTRYQESCGACPQLRSGFNHDLSSFMSKRKKSCWKRLPITIVSPSRWLAACAASSALFKQHRIEVIPNGLDLARFKPIERHAARIILNLPVHKKLILYGGFLGTKDTRKGFEYLKSALQLLNKSGLSRDAELVIFGSSSRNREVESLMNVHYLGTLNDDISMSIAYSCADVFVAPSTQDNLPNTVMEALSCGTPCVAFNIGGMPDLIEHEKSGFLCKPFEPDSLVEGINWVLNDDRRWNKLSHRALEKIKREYDILHIANRYRTLYDDVIETERQMSIRA